MIFNSNANFLSIAEKIDFIHHGLMKKSWLFICLVLYFLSANSKTIGAPLFFRPLNITLDIPPAWFIKNQNSEIVLNKANTATLNISMFILDQALSGKQIQSKRKNSEFSSYQILLERPGSFAESERANADESLVTVYTKKYIDTQNEETIEDIIADYIFMSENRCYIMTLSTQKKYWEQVQTDFKWIVSNFIIGEKQKEKIDQWYLDPDWICEYKNFHHSFSGIFTPQKNTLLQEMWRVDADEQSRFLVVKDQLLLQTETELKAITLSKGSGLWTKPFNGKPMLHPVADQTHLYTCIQDETEYKLFKISLLNGDISWIKKLPARPDELLLHQNQWIIRIQNALYAYNTQSGELMWKKDLDFFIVQGPLSDGQNLALIGTGNIKFLSPSETSVTLALKNCVQLAALSTGKWIGLNEELETLSVFQFDMQQNKMIWKTSLGTGKAMCPLSIYPPVFAVTYITDNAPYVHLYRTESGEKVGKTPLFSLDVNPLLMSQGLLMLEGYSPVIWYYPLDKKESISILWPNISIAPIFKKVVPYKNQLLILVNENQNYSIRCIR